MLCFGRFFRVFCVSRAFLLSFSAPFCLFWGELFVFWRIFRVFSTNSKLFEQNSGKQIIISGGFLCLFVFSYGCFVFLYFSFFAVFLEYFLDFLAFFRVFHGVEAVVMIAAVVMVMIFVIVLIIVAIVEGVGSSEEAQKADLRLLVA